MPQHSWLILLMPSSSLILLPVKRRLAPERPLPFPWSRRAWHGSRMFLTLPVPDQNSSSIFIFQLTVKESRWWSMFTGAAGRLGTRQAIASTRTISMVVARLRHSLDQLSAGGYSTMAAQIEDCKAAIRWLKAHAREYGYSANRPRRSG